MGFNFRGFLHRAGTAIKRVGHKVNHSFNAIKHHSKTVLPVIKRAAHNIRLAAENWSSLPVVGAVASQVGAGMRGIHAGAEAAERVIHAGDKFQESLGLRRSVW